MKIVEVTWIDATLETDNLPIVSEIKPLKRTTLGYLHEEYDDYIVLTFGYIHNFHKGEDACEMKSALPRAMILEIRELK